jgi:D-glucosaminate-6-phosphate ammonia-lyase
MRTSKKISIVASVSLLSLGLSIPLRAVLADDAGPATGTWLITAKSKAGTTKPKLVLTQEGQHVTGSYSGDFGQHPVTGDIVGDKISMQYKIKLMFREFAINYVGTIAGNKMSGELHMGVLGDGSFEGVKQ